MLKALSGRIMGIIGKTASQDKKSAIEKDKVTIYCEGTPEKIESEKKKLDDFLYNTEKFVSSGLSKLSKSREAGLLQKKIRGFSIKLFPKALKATGNGTAIGFLNSFGISFSSETLQDSSPLEA